MLGQEGFVDIQVLHRQGVSINSHKPRPLVPGSQLRPPPLERSRAGQIVKGGKS